ncbi:MAG: hypothetical protein E7298_01250 [Lachnospiraceae bacterium]|nr:hypothetical protein [Lachnospiraceae bacterium]
MIVFACKKCKYTDLSDKDSDYICPRCGGLMTSLGVDSAAWNRMSQEEMKTRVDAVYDLPLTETVNTGDGSKADDKKPEHITEFTLYDKPYQPVKKVEKISRGIDREVTGKAGRKTPVSPGFIIAAAAAVFVLASFLMWNNIRGLFESPVANIMGSEDQIQEIPEPEEVSKKSEASDYDLTDCLYYSTMIDEERVIYTALYDLVMHKDEPGYVREVTMEEYEFAKIKDNFKFIYMAMLEDHPEFFYLQSDSVRYPEVEEYSNNFTTHIKLSLTPGRDNENEMIAKFERAADDFMKDIDLNASEAEIELQIHDKLIDYVSYDRDILSKMIVEDLAHTAYGALVEDSRGLRRKAVCDGYAYAFQYLLSKAGIQSAVVVGKADFGGEDPLDEVYHAWNIVKLDGQWYETDCCWDDFELQKSIRDVYVLKEIEKNEEKYYLTTHHWYNRTTSQMKNLAASERTRFFIAGYESFNIIEDSTHIRGMNPQSEGYELYEYLNTHLPEAFGTEYGM